MILQSRIATLSLFSYKLSVLIEMVEFWTMRFYETSVEFYHFLASPGSSIGCEYSWYSGGHRFYPLVRQYSVLEIGYEIISMTILSLPLVQLGQLSVTGEKMYQVLVNRLGLRLPRKSEVRFIDLPTRP